MPDRTNIIYLFTTFPVITETPSQREIRVMRNLSVDLDIYSLWGGERYFEDIHVKLFSKWRLLTLIWYLPYWIIKRPGVMLRHSGKLLNARMTSWLNLGETLIGICFALCHASTINRRSPDLMHAAWANMPASAAQLIKGLTGIPFTMGAHAYDVFRDGGDCLLESKINDASFIITSSYSTLHRLLERGADPARTTVIRRGLDIIPGPCSSRSPRNRLRILSVARLVEKKGYLEQLDIYKTLMEKGAEFTVHIVGGGPLLKVISKRIRKLGLSDKIELLGAIPYEKVLDQYQWADVLVFTGKIAADENRDGLPNVIPEAMACGVPVVSSLVGGVPEVIEDGVNGIIVPDFDTSKWCAVLIRLSNDDVFYEKLRTSSRKWVEENFDAKKNTLRILEVFRSVKSENTVQRSTFNVKRSLSGIVKQDLAKTQRRQERQE